MSAPNSSHELVTEANRAFYAATAAEYDRKHQGATVQLAKEHASVMLECISGLQEGGRDVLDFAAGTGLLAMLLSPHVSNLYAVDLSQDMIQVLERKLQDQPTSSPRIENVHPIAADLLSGTPSQLEGNRVDVLTCTMAFHHFADPIAVTKVLARFIKSGGYLAIVDLVHQEEEIKLGEDDKPQHGQRHGAPQVHGHEHVIVHKHGFSEADVVSFCNAAGLELERMDKASSFNWHGKMNDTFLAIARKP